MKRLTECDAHDARTIIWLDSQGFKKSVKDGEECWQKGRFYVFPFMHPIDCQYLWRAYDILAEMSAAGATAEEAFANLRRAFAAFALATLRDLPR